MKIGFVVGTLGRGGAERQLLFMLRAARDIGFEPRVLCLTAGETHESQVRDLGIEPQWVGQTQSQFSRLQRIIRKLREDPVDIIQSSHFYTNLYAAVAGRAVRRPAIGAIRSDLKTELAEHGRLGKLQLKMPRHLIANSENAKRRALGLGIAESRIDVVRNVVEVLPGERDERAELIVLFVGRLVEAKQPEIFIDLASRVSNRMASQKVSFVIAGDGPLRASLEAMTKDLGLSDTVKFLGERDDISCVYRTADVLVSTSRYEGTPNAILEAMAHGIPVVAANVGGVADLLRSDRGILVDPENFLQMEEEVISLLEDKVHRRKLGEEGRRYVEAVHSFSSLQQHLADIYQRLLTDRRK